MMAYTTGPETVAPEGFGAAILEGIGADQRVLVFGDAKGEWIPALLQRQCRVTAMSKEAFRDDLEAQVERLSVGEGYDGAPLSALGEDRFDVVLIADAFDSLTDPVAFLGGLKRHLRPGGCVIASLLNSTHVSVRLVEWSRSLFTNGRGAQAPIFPRSYHRDGLRMLFEEAGFRIDRVERVEWEISAAQGTEGLSSIPETIRLSVLSALTEDPEANTYQYLVRTAPEEDTDHIEIQNRLQLLASEEERLKQEVSDLRVLLGEQNRRLDSYVPRQELSHQLASLQEIVTRQLASRPKEPPEELLFLPIPEYDLVSLPEPDSPFRNVGHGTPSKKFVNYQRIIHRIRGALKAVAPAHSMVVVVSRGDDELIQLDGFTGWHFPCTEKGIYAGAYPATSRDAIDHLEGLRTKGAGILLFPETAFWWLDYYAEFKQHLDANYRLLANLEDTCVIYDLLPVTDSGPPA